jgi:ABC-type transport system involved in cytochrome c biogenesis permease subunit
VAGYVVSRRSPLITRGGAVAALVCALVTGCLWGPVVQARWYTFFVAAGIALALGLAVFVTGRAVGLAARAALVATVVALILANAAVFVWAVTHSH